MRRLLLFLLVFTIVDSCSSGKAALKKGDYYDAVLSAIHRLRGSPDNKKAKAVLSQGYPLAIEYIDTNIQNGINADDPMKWRNAVKGYEQINNINDQIKTSLGAMKIITNPATRYKELAEAKTKAAEESYQAGITALMKNTRADAKQAYFDFKTANDYEPGYRESIEMMTQAEFNATLRVAYEEINASSINYGSLQPVINSLQRQFLSFKPITQKDTVPPHQYLKIIFNGYREDGRTTTTNTTEEVKKDIKTGEKTGADGKKQDIMETVTAKITYFHKVKRASSGAAITISDAGTSAILQNQNVDGNALWQYDWATCSGDPRALAAIQVNLCKLKESYPAEQYLFNQSIANLKTNLGSQLRSFYSRY
jgi:hypothetical protein